MTPPVPSKGKWRSARLYPTGLRFCALRTALMRLEVAAVFDFIVRLASHPFLHPLLQAIRKVSYLKTLEYYWDKTLEKSRKRPGWGPRRRSRCAPNRGCHEVTGVRRSLTVKLPNFGQFHCKAGAGQGKGLAIGDGAVAGLDDAAAD